MWRKAGQCRQLHAGLIGKELLVTTRITQVVQLAGTPVSKVAEDSPIVKRGNEIRNEIASRPLKALQHPTVVFTTIERALQSGWIARGPNNQIIPGPGDIQLTRDPEGNVITKPTTQASKDHKAQPTIFISYDPGTKIHVQARSVTKKSASIQACTFTTTSSDGKLPVDFGACTRCDLQPRTGGIRCHE